MHTVFGLFMFVMKLQKVFYHICVIYSHTILGSFSRMGAASVLMK